MKFGIFLIILISNEICNSSPWSGYRIRKDEYYVDYERFMQRDNTNITYLDSYNGTKIQACEYMNTTLDWIKDDEVKVGDEMKISGIYLKYYWSNIKEPYFQLYKYDDNIKCLNSILQLQFMNISIKRYLGSEVSRERIILVKNSFDIDKSENYCNRESVSVSYNTKELPANENYTSSTEFVLPSSVVIGPDVEDQFLKNLVIDVNWTFPAQPDVEWIEKNALFKHWNRTQPSQNITVEPLRGIAYETAKVHMKKERIHRANFEIGPFSREDTRTIREFRQELKKRMKVLHQSEHGVYIDFNLDADKNGPIVLKNVPVIETIEHVVEITRVLNVPCKDAE